MSELNLSFLASQISSLHEYLQRRAQQQVNNALTIRNWIVGLYIVEYEQNGSDRAIYGAKAIKELADLLKRRTIKGLDERSLRTCRAFYQAYPQIWGTVSAKLQNSDNEDDAKWRTVSPILIFPTLSGKLESTALNQTASELLTNKEKVITKAKDEIPVLPIDVMKNPYFLEFLELEERTEYSERSATGGFCKQMPGSIAFG